MISRPKEKKIKNKRVEKCFEEMQLLHLIRKYKDDLWLDADGKLNYRQFVVEKIKRS
jgi:hypothetical protein